MIDLKKDIFRINHVMREISCEIVIREVGCRIVSNLDNSFPTAFPRNSSNPPICQCTNYATRLRSTSVNHALLCSIIVINFYKLQTVLCDFNRFLLTFVIIVHNCSISSTVAASSSIGLQYLMLFVQLCAPDDGRRNRLKRAQRL
jgi:hypothetical protein